MSTSVRVSILMPLVGLYRQPPCWKSPYNWLMILTMDLAMFCDSLSAMGPPCGPFHLEKGRAPL